MKVLNTRIDKEKLKEIITKLREDIPANEFHINSWYYGWICGLADGLLFPEIAVEELKEITE